MKQLIDKKKVIRELEKLKVTKPWFESGASIRFTNTSLQERHVTITLTEGELIHNDAIDQAITTVLSIKEEYEKA